MQPNKVYDEVIEFIASSSPQHVIAFCPSDEPSPFFNCGVLRCLTLPNTNHYYYFTRTLISMDYVILIA